MKVLTGKALRYGEIKSCGCRKGEMISQSKRRVA